MLVRCRTSWTTTASRWPATNWRSMRAGWTTSSTLRRRRRRWRRRLDRPAAARPRNTRPCCAPPSTRSIISIIISNSISSLRAPSPITATHWTTTTPASTTASRWNQRQMSTVHTAVYFLFVAVCVSKEGKTADALVVSTTIWSWSVARQLVGADLVPFSRYRHYSKILIFSNQPL